MVNNTCDVDISFDILWKFSDKIAAEDTPQGMSHQHDLLSLETMNKSDDQLREMLG